MLGISLTTVTACLHGLIRYIRALNVSDLAVLREKVEGCFEGAAVSTGCEVEMEWLADTAKDDWEHGAHIYASAPQRPYRSRVPCLWPLIALAAAAAAVRDLF